MQIFANKKAQSTAEYVIVLGLVVAAVIAMQTYVKRGLQGRVRDAVNFVDNGGQTDGGVVQFTGAQHEPAYLSSNFDSTRNASEAVDMEADGAVATDTTTDISTRTGDQTFEAPVAQQ